VLKARYARDVSRERVQPGGAVPERAVGFMRLLGGVTFTRLPLDAPQQAGGRKVGSPSGELELAKGKEPWYR